MAALEGIIASKEWAGRVKDRGALPELYALRDGGVGGRLGAGSEKGLSVGEPPGQGGSAQCSARNVLVWRPVFLSAACAQRVSNVDYLKLIQKKPRWTSA